MKLASNLVIDSIDYANQGNTFLGIRGSGKSYAATKAAEELLDSDIPIIAIDPIGVWHNLKNGINGHAGYQVVVIGGQHADLPLSEDTIVSMVKAALESRVSLVIDLKGVSSSNKSQWIRIVTDVIETLMELNDQYGPRHVFIEEAAEFIPQKLNPGLYKVYSRIESMARMGRNVGLGYTLINARAEEIAKAIFELSEQVFVFRQAGKNSLKSIKDWLDYKGLKEMNIIPELPRLLTGECWSFNQTQELRCKILPKNTFHPDPKKRTQEMPANTRKADPSVFISEMKAVMEKSAEVAEPKGKSKRQQGIELNFKAIGDANAELAKQNDLLRTKLAEEQGRVLILSDFLSQIKDITSSAIQLDVSATLVNNIEKPIKSLQPVERMPVSSSINHTGYKKGKLSGGAPMRMLQAAAMFPAGITKSRMCIIAGIKTGGSSYRSGISQLRVNGDIESNGEYFTITKQGLKNAGPVNKIDDLVTFWLGIIGNGAPGRILRGLDKVYPNTYTMNQLCGLAGIEPKGSSWRSGISILRKNKLVVQQGSGFKLNDELK